MPHLVKFKFDPASGRIGLYHDTAGDDAPLTDPLNHLGDVIFHPDLRYPGVVKTIASTLALPAGPNTSFPRQTTHNLGAHLQTGKPMMLGRILGIGPSGSDVAWVGSLPVQQYIQGDGLGTSLVRWLALGADDTNIFAYEISRGAAAVQLPAINLDYEIYILDRNLEAVLPSGTMLAFRSVPGGGVEIETPNGGTFSSEKGYLRANGAGGFAVAGGKTMQIRRNGTIGGTVYEQQTWKWSLGSGKYEMVCEYVFDLPPPIGNGNIHRPPTAFTPRVEEVSL